jgi:hypothetical protein
MQIAVLRARATHRAGLVGRWNIGWRCVSVEAACN